LSTTNHTITDIELNHGLHKISLLTSCADSGTEIYEMSLGSSVGVASRLQAWWTAVRILAGARAVRAAKGSTQPSIEWTPGLVSGGKADRS
jgi:hypothetical protein